MTLLWIILLIGAQLGERVMGDYRCTMKSFEVTCSGITAEELPQDVSVTLNKTDIQTLNITNGVILAVSNITFKDFTNLDSLYIIDSKVSKLEDNAFAGSSVLQYLSLSKNSLAEFNLQSFPPNNQLKFLDLSYNFIDDFSHFNSSYFPILNVLNLTGNFLSFLPVSLLKTLKEINNIYIIIDDNPWNCSHPKWAGNLTDIMVNAFCTNKTYSPTTTTTSTTSIVSTENAFNAEDRFIENNHAITPVGTEKPTEDCEKPNCLNCSFYYCLWWLFCGIWIGIIIWNIGKIRNLICRKPTTYTEESTQCEYSMVENHTRPGVYDTTFHKLPPARTTTA